jgi:short subunit dehydrogenase-like uncharacterized protein
MKSFTQNEMNDLTNWLGIITTATESEFIERFSELSSFVPMPIIGIARRRLNNSTVKRFDKLTDFAFCEDEVRQ